MEMFEGGGRGVNWPLLEEILIQQVLSSLPGGRGGVRISISTWFNPWLRIPRLNDI